jgi:hypothetical protein
MDNPGLAGLHFAIVILCALLMLLFYRRRQLHPLAGRYPKSSILSAWLVILTLLNQAFTGAMDISGYSSSHRLLHRIALTLFFFVSIDGITQVIHVGYGLSTLRY